MKKTFAVAILFIFAILCIPVVAMENTVTISINDVTVEFPDAQPFIDENNRTQVPVRAIAEALGKKVDWFGDTKTVIIGDGNGAEGDSIVFVIDSKEMRKNEQRIVMDTDAILKDNRIYVPVSFLVTNLNYTVQWDNATNHINLTPNSDPAFSIPSTGKIYLYGEQHGVEKIMDRQLELWDEYYKNDNMRHLFIEIPYYSAEFLNVWMQSDNDDILDTLYNDWNGTAMQVSYTKVFYKWIKSECPETIFHGTDVGHQYGTTGVRYLKYLEDNGLSNSEQYVSAKRAIEQGKYYYSNEDHEYRENKMSENFIHEFDRLVDKNVMGIYGSAHTGLDDMNYITKSVPSMAGQLKARYGDNVYSENLSWLALPTDALRVDSITVNRKEYEASYFGEQDISNLNLDFIKREFWRLENAYNDFKDNSKTGDVLPFNNYPMAIEEGQIFVIDYTKKDGSVIRLYYRSDGTVWQGNPSTAGFIAE